MAGNNGFTLFLPLACRQLQLLNENKREASFLRDARGESEESSSCQVTPALFENSTDSTAQEV